jgi:hypothetical protein
MEFPLVESLHLTTEIDYVLAFIIGIGFGFFLESAGFGNANKLAAQFYFRDMTVFKVMFTAIIVAMSGLIFLQSFGYIDMDLVFLNPTYLWPGIAGGLIMGAGFIIGGYCPGTSVVGISTLKTDAFFSVAGGMTGMVIFAEVEPFVHSFFMSGFQGHALTLDSVLNIPAKYIGAVIVIGAVLAFWGAEKVEKLMSKKGAVS